MARPGFPATLREFQLAFADEDACARYLASCRWPDGFRCPMCGNDRAYLLTEHRRWQCASPACRRQTSLTAGTILERSKVPLTTWFWAAYLVTTDKRGVSAAHIQRQLGLSYEASWLLLHKLRRAMVVPDREKLRGIIEMDETWVGGPQAGLRGSRQLKGRKAALVIVAVEHRGTGSGRVRMEVIPDFTRDTMTEFALRNIEVGSTIVSDKMTGFDRLSSVGYRRRAPRGTPCRTDGRSSRPTRSSPTRTSPARSRRSSLAWQGRRQSHYRSSRISHPEAAAANALVQPARSTRLGVPGYHRLSSGAGPTGPPSVSRARGSEPRQARAGHQLSPVLRFGPDRVDDRVEGHIAECEQPRLLSPRYGPVCANGIVTDFFCGSIRNVDVDVNNGVLLLSQRLASIHIAQGDSGATVFYGTTIHGIVHTVSGAVVKVSPKTWADLYYSQVRDVEIQLGVSAVLN